MEDSPTPSSTQNSFATKFIMSAVLLLTFVGAACAYTYSTLSGDLTASQQTGLLTGLGAIMGSLVISLVLVGAVVGRGTLRDLETLTNRAEQMRGGDLDVELETTRTDEIGALYQAFDSMRGSLQTRIREIEDTNDRLQECADEYRQQMNRVQSEGDLTVRLDENVEDDVMRDIAIAFNQMMDDIEEQVADVREFTEAVAETAEDLSEQTDEAMDASAEIHSAAQGFTQDGTTIIETSSDPSALLEKAATDGASVSAADIDAAIEADETVDSLEDLSQRMDQIGEVTDFISDIVSQTNMLALQAEVQAANADTNADGFEVVAEEIKGLSTETQESTDEVEDALSDLRNGTSEALEQVLAQEAQFLLLMDEQAEQVAEDASELNDSLSRFDVRTFNAENGGGRYAAEDGPEPDGEFADGEVDAEGKPAATAGDS